MTVNWLGALIASMISVSVPAVAQPGINVMSDGKAPHADLDALAVLPTPKQRTDLDTYQLASAHRERAETLQERTNGLWQSWIVSICEGCGPQISSYKERNFEFRRDASVKEQAPSTKPAAKIAAGEPARRAKTAGIYADLSPIGLAQIRRMRRE